MAAPPGCVAVITGCAQGIGTATGQLEDVAAVIVSPGPPESGS